VGELVAVQRAPSHSEVLARSKAVAATEQTLSALAGTDVQADPLAKQVRTDTEQKKRLQDESSTTEKLATGTVARGESGSFTDLAPLPEMRALLTDRHKLADPESLASMAIDLSMEAEGGIRKRAYRLILNAGAGGGEPAIGSMTGFITETVGPNHPKVQSRAVVSRARLTEKCRERASQEEWSFVIDSAASRAKLYLAPTTTVGPHGQGRPTQPGTPTDKLPLGRAQAAEATDYWIARARAQTATEEAVLKQAGFAVNGVLEFEGGLMAEFKAGGRAADGFVQHLNTGERTKFPLATLVLPDGSTTTWLIDYPYDRPKLVDHLVVAAVGANAPSVQRSIATAKARGVPIEFVPLTPEFRQDVRRLADSYLKWAQQTAIARGIKQSTGR
jgi:hypothetical protein